MLDVAAVTETLLSLEPHSTIQRIANLLELPAGAAPRLIATLVGLHDFGKAIPGFQNKWPQGRQSDEAAGLPFESHSMHLTDHALASGGLLADFLNKKDIPTPLIHGILQAISAHHGYNFLSRELDAALPDDALPWREARQQLFEAYWETLTPEAVPRTEEPSLAAVEWLAGLTSIADWIGSNPEWFSLEERSENLIEHFHAAKTLAKRALDQIGWQRYRALLHGEADTPQLLFRILQAETSIDPRPLQTVGDNLLRQVNGPALMLVEAPMGEGKTELAFLAHLRLQRANSHRGLYVALPTKATGNALFDRTLTFLQSFAADESLDIQLIHGGAAWSEQIQKLRGIFGSPGEAVTSSAWFSQRRRPLLSHYGVGTIDQALFATLNVKHHFVRLWGLANRVIVLDEVHAYDWYTGGLIESLLRWLKPLGCSVVLMSATLPRERRNSLLRAWDRTLPIPEPTTYPRLLLADNNGIREESFESRPLPSIYLDSVDEGLDAIAALAINKLVNGGDGAIIVNTVDRAQQLFQTLRDTLEEDTKLYLFHARFPADSRAEREHAVLKRFGAACDKRDGRALLIATQVAEQSLDIDFDFMITDLAPVDLVLQRAGRLHRHRRTRPHAHRQAVLTIAGLHRDRLPEMTENAWKFVYNEHILGRSWAFLSRESKLQMPGDIDRLVQTVYAPEKTLPKNIPTEIQSHIEQAQGEHLAEKLVGRQTAQDVSIDPDSEPTNAYEGRSRGYEEGEAGIGREKRTRLDCDSVTVVPVHKVADGWAVNPDSAPFTPDRPVSDAQAKTLYARQLSISHKGLVKHFHTLESPLAFSEHPLLRHLKPLELLEAKYQVGDTALHLCEELGLVITKG
jgi:CRISPR-associated endonuclease/helicase Cas3